MLVDKTKKEILSLIEQKYHFKIASCVSGSRGYVAETFLLTDEEGQACFAKITDKSLFKKQIIESLPVLESMHNSGVQRICYPLRGNGGLFCEHNNYLIVLFNYINAPQSYDYSQKVFGNMLGQIHALTPDVDILPKKETFMPDKVVSIYNRLTVLLNNVKLAEGDEFLQEFIDICSLHIEEITRYKDRFVELANKCKVKSDAYTYVITHGDAGGNTLVNSKEDLYLIDWDDILLAPAERDTWIPYQDKDFMEGYISANPSYHENKDLLGFYTYKYFFICLNYIIDDILRTDLSNEERHAIINLYLRDTLSQDSWFYPYLQTALF